ncbi:MAG: bifunctional proline dehydrogenase/L-glutamate gamma-semialdehyde dehydrogenase PutA [Burkholderiales bacterium]|nr:bifunctional proline dehydrogenase/L-glutamate gamma-semialdehyde dehydrogenase PutA [Burkholderiales bacterium]
MSASAEHLAAARRAIARSYRVAEAEALETLGERLRLSCAQRRGVAARALELAQRVRERAHESAGAEAFLRRYSLSTREGVVLMCLAEALLRIPDAGTADALIRDKLAGTRWEGDAGGGEEEGGLLVNAATWGLMLTGTLAAWGEAQGEAPAAVLRRLAARLGEPLARAAIRQAMKIMAGQFIAGETIAEAIERAAGERGAEQYRYSYDMRGVAARTAGDAERYLAAYEAAIDTVGRAAAGDVPVEARPGVSIKLSALHPRFEPAQRGRVMTELAPRLASLAARAAAAGIPVTIDAEESERLELTLELFEALARDPRFAGWQGLGLAVQAYQRRGIHLCDWLAALAAASGRRLMVRLVKGAYWDSEVKAAQVQGVDDYPVFTRKSATDVSYLACAQALFEAGAAIYPQFATHNSHSVAAVLACAGERRDFEFQKLQGMGDALYEALVPEAGVACRVYAPVGGHRDLLAYLVRRLLENGANSSFVHQVGDPGVPLERLVADPLERLPRPYVPHPRVPLPRDLYPGRRNSRGPDRCDRAVLERLSQRVAADRAQALEAIADSDPAAIDAAARGAAAAFRVWDATPVEERARCLERAGDLLEARMDEFVSLAVREAGKTLPDAVAEVREAVDYCRYYAQRARADFGEPLALAGPTGESNRLELAGRGAFACISPWNFPLAIFTGQVSAALVAGNAVLAKPAEQTPRIAARVVALLHEAGVPRAALRLVCGTGEAAGAPLVRHSAVAGVVFTGSFETARAINRTLAQRAGPIVPFIAETGGMNALVIDSSALPEQVVADAIASAFQSAGQRCSAARVLAVQEEAAPRILPMLAGAMAELSVGDPALPETDVGPVIDAEAKRALDDYVAWLRPRARLLAQAPLAACDAPLAMPFVAPVAFEIDIADLPQREVFGPVLHVLRWKSGELERLLDALAATGYGLTLGIHSRIEHFVARVRARLPVGNTYVNRSMIGAVVGVQPFGGEGLSGPGPKAGGPHYLPRFALERTLTVNTAAAGGNATLLGEVD